MDYSSLYYQKTDAKQFETEAILANAALLISLILYSLEVLPFLLLILIISIAITRWMICVHELFHIVKGEQTSPLVRLILIPFTPLNIGYDEYQQVHMGHHRYNAGVEDPEGYHIRKDHLNALLVSMVYPEQSFFRYIKEYSLTPSQWMRVGLRLCLFLALLSLFQEGFVVFFLILRACYGVNIWIFFHALHSKDGKFGTFAVNFPDYVKIIYRVLYGKHSLEGTLHHNVHHQWPRMAYWHLSEHQTEMINLTQAQST